MKVLILLIFISFPFVISNAQNKVIDREFDRLKGKVKSVTESYSTFENQNGNLIERKSGVQFEKHFDENGNTTLTLNYIVGDKNIYSFINGEKTFKSETIKGVGGAGRAEMKESNPKPRDERYSIKFKYKYNDINQIEEETLYNNDGELNSRTVFRYDEKGRIKERERYNSYKSNKLTFRTTLAYDNDNNLSQELLFIINGSTTYKYTYTDYKFDSEGNWVERIQTSNYKINGQDRIAKRIEHRKIEYY